MKLRWKRILAVVAAPLLIAVAVYGSSTEAELVEYRTEVEAGDTVWDLCAKVASDQDNMEELVYRTMHDNHISKDADIQPGQLIIIRVKPVGRKE